jgi:iron(III) transport system substrate-binding protein
LDFAYGAEVQPSWQAEWERAVKAAEQEGEVVIYSTSSADPVFREAFQKKFPKIKVTTVTGRGFQLGQRILAERRAGKYIPDVFVQGATTPTTVVYPAKALDPVRPLLILPEVVDQSKWWQGKHHYVDPEGEYIFMFEGSASSGAIVYNTSLVHPKELRSYWDLLDSKWKGKIVSMDPTVAGPGSQSVTFFYYHPELGPEFLRKLYSEMDITVIREDERLVDWVSVGKFAIGLFPRGREVGAAQKAGLPIKEFLPGNFREGAFISPTGFTISFFNRAPHPNAAKVLINWFLSREGQSTMLEYAFKAGDSIDSLREDIPKEKVDPAGRRVPGISYLNTIRYEWINNRKPIHELLKKALAEAKKP